VNQLDLINEQIDRLETERDALIAKAGEYAARGVVIEGPVLSRT
jgi:hypothetical protein